MTYRNSTCRETVLVGARQSRTDVTSLLVAVSDESDVELVHFTIVKTCLINMKDRKIVIITLLIGKFIELYVVPNLVVEHIVYLTDDGTD